MSTKTRRLPVVDVVIPTKRIHQFVGFTIIIVVWELYGRTTGSFAMAPFTEVTAAFIDLYVSGQIYGPLGQSLQQLVIGYSLAVAVAVPVGMAMGMSSTIRYLLDTYVNVMFVTSVSSLLPFLIIIFGTQLRFRVAVVFLFAVFHMILNIQAGVDNVDKELLKTGRAFGARGPALYRYVVFPAALPLIIAGLRLGIGRSLKGMVVAELWIYAGIGSLLRGYQQYHQVDYALAIVISLMILAVLSVRILYAMEHRYAPWEAEKGR